MRLTCETCPCGFSRTGAQHWVRCYPPPVLSARAPSTPARSDRTTRQTTVPFFPSSRCFYLRQRLPTDKIENKHVNFRAVIDSL